MRQENVNRLSFVRIRIWDTQIWTDGQGEPSVIRPHQDMGHTELDRRPGRDWIDLTKILSLPVLPK